MFGNKRWITATAIFTGAAGLFSRRVPGFGKGAVWLLAIVAFAAFAGCSDNSTTRTVPAAYDPDTEYSPDITASELSIGEGNTFFPLTVGASWVYEVETDEGTERIEVEVTSDTQAVWDLNAVVVRDTVTLDGELIEDTWDWYAQDTAGNVWYLGEDTFEYEGGEVVCSCGAWESGVDGALPGIVMLGDPQVGDFYRQEYYAGEAEDLGEIVSVGETVEVAAGTFTGCIQTHDTSAINAEIDEYKFYCPGVGVVLEVEGDERVELISYSGQ